MRRTLLLMVISALLLTQCRKPAVEFPTAEPANTVSMTITAGPGGKTDISETGGITWSTGDKLYVGYNNTYVGYLTLVSGQNTPTGTFTGSVTLPNSTTGEQTFHFFYLGSGSQTLTAGESTQATVSFASQTGLRGGLGSCHVGHGSAKGTVSDGGVTGINVMMKSEVALSRFSFKKSGTPASPYTGALTLSGDHIYNSMTVDFGGTFTGAKTDGGEISLTDATSSEKYVMLVPAGATAATLKFDAGAGTTDCNLANGIEANKYYGQGGAIEVMVTAPTPASVFTVNKASGTTVEFAPGNLYYNGADNSHKMNETLPSGWNFYGHQWDCYPSGTTSVTASNEISLFTWGYGEWSTVYNTTTYQTDNTMTDWGTAPGLPSAGEGKKWRTLTVDEWKNLLGIIGGKSPRDNASSLCAWVTLKITETVSVPGLVILPDGSTVTASTVTTTALVASSGAVFLPAAGYRNGTNVSGVGSNGSYWSSAPNEDLEIYACSVSFNSGYVSSLDDERRNRGRAVRLVR